MHRGSGTSHSARNCPVRLSASAQTDSDGVLQMMFDRHTPGKRSPCKASPNPSSSFPPRMQRLITRFAQPQDMTDLVNTSAQKYLELAQKAFGGAAAVRGPGRPDPQSHGQLFDLRARTRREPHGNGGRSTGPDDSAGGGCLEDDEPDRFKLRLVAGTESETAPPTGTSSLFRCLCDFRSQPLPGAFLCVAVGNRGHLASSDVFAHRRPPPA